MTQPTAPLDLDAIVLRNGGHTSPSDGLCLLEAVAYVAGERHTDQPACVDPALSAFGRSWNDGMRTDAEREQLKPYVLALVGTAGTPDDASRRAWLALDWSVRVSTPAWLDLAGLADHAERLRGRRELTGPDDETFEMLAAARRDAAAARAAAWDAAADAAWAAAADAARAAAWAAAAAAARAAAAAASGAASGDAAAAAARDAAAAASGDAAAASLEPTVLGLQRSAHVLFRTMIAAGPCNRELLDRLPEVSR